MRAINQVEIMGFVGSDPRISETAGGKRATFSVATSYTTKAGVEKTEWHNCVAWEGRADAVERFLRRGHLVLLKGSLQYFRVETADDKTVKAAEINVRNIWFLTRDDRGGK